MLSWILNIKTLVLKQINIWIQIKAYFDGICGQSDAAKQTKILETKLHIKQL